MKNCSFINAMKLSYDTSSFIKNKMKNKVTSTGIFTGIDAVDAATEGIKSGQVITIAEDSTCLMSLFSQFIENISVKQNIPGLVYTT